MTTLSGDHGPENNLKYRLGFFTSAVFLVFAIARSPSLFRKPRMWAEEATWFYNQFQFMDFEHSITLIYRENYQFLTNLIVYVSTLFRAVWAAHVTTYVSLAVSTFVAYCLGLLVASRKAPWLFIVPLAAIWAFLPPGYEIFYTVTNLQWVCSISMLVLLTLPLERVGRGHRLVFWAWSIVCGLTGVPSCIVAPAFLFRGIAERRKDHLIIGLLLSACAVFQLAIILTHPALDVRLFPHNAKGLLLPALLQTCLSPILGNDIVELIAIQIRSDAMHSGMLVFVAALSAAMVLAFCTMLAWSEVSNRCLVVALVGLWIGASIINTFGSLGEPSKLIAGSYNNRYFALGDMCLILLLFLSTRSPNLVAKRISLSLIVYLTILFVGQALWSPSAWIIRNAGPRWKSQIEACGDRRPCTVTVWPTPEWNFPLHRL